MSDWIKRVHRLKIIKKLNSYSFMPVVWWSLLAVILMFLLPLVRLPSVFRLAFIFLLFNLALSFHLGRLVKSEGLAWYVIFIFPLVFCLVVWTRFAAYNYPLAVAYLTCELLGCLSDDVYRKKRRS